MKSYTYFVVKYFIAGDPSPKYIFNDSPELTDLIKAHPEIERNKCKVITITATNDSGESGRCETIEIDGKKYTTADKGDAIVLHKFDDGSVDLLI